MDIYICTCIVNAELSVGGNAQTSESRRVRERKRERDSMR